MSENKQEQQPEYGIPYKLKNMVKRLNNIQKNRNTISVDEFISKYSILYKHPEELNYQEEEAIIDIAKNFQLRFDLYEPIILTFPDSDVEPLTIPPILQSLKSIDTTRFKKELNLARTIISPNRQTLPFEQIELRNCLIKAIFGSQVEGEDNVIEMEDIKEWYHERVNTLRDQRKNFRKELYKRIGTSPPVTDSDQLNSTETEMSDVTQVEEKESHLLNKLL